jgi:hypothetical protein
MHSFITATFKTRDAAEHVLQELDAIGVTDKQISLIVTDETRGNSFNIETHSKAEEGGAIGAAAGGILGGIFGSLATATAIAIPGLNIVVAGALVSGLAGLGAGAATGGLLGALVGSGIPEHEAKLHEDQVKDGAILLAVHPKTEEQEETVRDILERADAHHVVAEGHA